LLAYKVVLLNAVASTHDPRIRTISCIIGIKRTNIQCAIECGHSLQTLGVLQWALSCRKKKLDGLSEKTKNIICLWWTNETQVNLNKKDVAHKCISPKQYEKHAIHFLL
jgi:hypothetical protein